MTEKNQEKIVEYGIKALKAIWHRGAVDADGKSGDGAGIQIEIAPEFFKEKFQKQVIQLMKQNGFALEWFFYQGRSILIKKNVRNNRVSFSFKRIILFTGGDKCQLIQAY